MQSFSELSGMGIRNTNQERSNPINPTSQVKISTQDRRTGKSTSYQTDTLEIVRIPASPAKLSSNYTVSSNGTLSSNGTSPNGTLSSNETLSSNGTLSSNEKISPDGTRRDTMEIGASVPLNLPLKRVELIL